MSKLVSKVDTTKATNEQHITRILSFGNGTKINLVHTIFESIKKAPEEEQPSLVQFLAESWDYIESSKEVNTNLEKPITEEEKDILRKKYGEIVDAMFTALLAENKDQKSFYKSLWDLINNPFFADDKAKVFALYYILIDKRIPYFQTSSGLKMSNEDFIVIQKKVRNSRAETRFILNKKFEQKSEQADLILKILRGHSEAEQAVLLVTIFSEFNQKIDQLTGLIKQLRS